MYPIGETTALSTTMSGPIRVLANNDVPSGAAFIPLVLETHENWEGWRASIDVQPRMPDGMQTDDNPDFSVSLSSMDTEAANTSTTLGSGESLLAVESSILTQIPLPDSCKSPREKCMQEGAAQPGSPMLHIFSICLASKTFC